MTLRRTMAAQIGALLAGLLLISGASLWGMQALRQDFSLALRGYQELRRVYEVASHIATAKALLTASKADDARVLHEVRTAAERFELFGADTGDGPPQSWHAAPATALRQALATATAAFREPTTGNWQLATDNSSQYAHRIAALDRVLGRSAELAAQIRRAVQEKERAAELKRRTTLAVMAGLSAVVVLGAIVLGIAQYRAVVTPLGRLGRAVTRIAGGSFQDRVPEQGHAEFVELARQFNRMAAELDGLYNELERKVQEKSRQLVRSERLASVGYLAAGVAHEINNPLSVITGYAEWSLQQLRQAEPSAGEDTGGTLQELARTLRLICEEGFRCKQIVEKLLTLARPGGETRGPVNLAALARQVAEAVGGLRGWSDRKLSVQCDEEASATVLASEGEMKQVLLNLTLNALEATGSGTGQVWIEVRREGPWVRLDVRDNGRGMTPATLERIFEPFFSERKAGGESARPPGTGLGLSISHAIVEAHGGQITAQSPGPGQGSCFTVRLPAQ